MFCETAPSAVLLGTWRRGCQVQAFFHMLFGDDAVELLADQRRLQEATRAGFFFWDCSLELEVQQLSNALAFHNFKH